MSSFIAWDVPTILSALLFLALVITLLDRFFPKTSSKQTQQKQQKQQKKANTDFLTLFYFMVFLKTHKTENLSQKRQPAQWAISLYPVILFVLILRSFLAEPFQIPSNSMMPTLLTGDFILVNKFIYGIRLPITNTKIITTSKPKYGDVIVFRYPNYEQDKTKNGVDYIKRVIGTPGDEILYKNDVLWVNGQKVTNTAYTNYQGVESGVAMTGYQHQKTQLNGVNYDTLLSANQTSKNYTPCSNSVQNAIKSSPILEFYPTSKHCSSHYKTQVPKGYYLVMGDNRLHSSDGRFWGFVPENFILGKAFFIWMHYDQSFKFSRLGSIK